MRKLIGTLRCCALATVLAVLVIGQAVAQEELHITISRIAGTVEVQNAVTTKGQWVAAKKDQTIGAGWSLRTGATSKVQLVFPKDNVVILKANSVLSVDKLDAGGGAKLSAKSGGLLADIKNALSPGSEFDVQTPNALAVVRGTKFAVEIKPTPGRGSGGGSVALNFMSGGRPLPVLQADTSFAVLLGGNGGKCVNADVDGDGKDEIVMPGTTAALLLPAVQKIREAASRARTSPGGGMPSVKFTDVNGDGKQDLVVTLPTGETVRAGDGSVRPQTDDFVLLSAGDLDGDGKPDYIVEGGTESAKVLDELALSGKIVTDNKHPDHEKRGTGDSTDVKIKQTTATDDIGDARDYQKEPGKIDFPNLADASLLSGHDLLDLQQAAADGSVRVAVGDVNGDGVADATLSRSSKSAGDGSVKLLGVGDVDGDSLPDYVYQHNQSDMDFVRRLYSDLLGRDNGDGGGVARDGVAPRDAASGQASGRRSSETGDSTAVQDTYKQFLGRDAGATDVNGQAGDAQAPRDAASGQATGRRSYTGGRFALEVDGATARKGVETSGDPHEYVSGKVLRDWIKASFDNKFLRKSGELHAADFKRDTRHVREFKDALLTETDMNGDGKSDLKITFEPDDTAAMGQPLSVENGGTGASQAHGAGGGGGAGKATLREFTFFAAGDLDGDGVDDFSIEGGKPTAAQFQALIDSLANMTDDDTSDAQEQRKVTVRGWDPEKKEAITGKSSTSLISGEPVRQWLAAQQSSLRKSGELQAADYKFRASDGRLLAARIDKLPSKWDGTQDLVLTVGAQDTGGTGRFSTKHPTKLEIPDLKAIGDQDGDGVGDFTAPSSQAILIALLMNSTPLDSSDASGAGQAALIVSGAKMRDWVKDAYDKGYRTPASGLSIATGDVNGDGRADLVIDFTPPAPGSGSPAEGRKGLNAVNVKLTAIDDQDGDGIADFVVQGGDDGALGILIGLLQPAASRVSKVDSFTIKQGIKRNDVGSDRSSGGGGGAGKVIISGARIEPVRQAGATGPIKWMAPEARTHGAGGGGGTGKADGSVRVATGDVNGDGLADVTLTADFVNAGGVVIVLDGVDDVDGDGLADYALSGGTADSARLDGILIGLLLPAVQTGDSSKVETFNHKQDFGPTQPSPRDTTRPGSGILTGAEWAELQAADQALADRDAASGQATGKSAPKDHATGLATGKRMHKPFVVTAGDVDGDGSVDLTVKLEVADRDAASGQASGKRVGAVKWKNIVLKRGLTDVDNDGLPDYSGDPADIEALRSYAAGHFELDLDSSAATDVLSPRDHASGLPTGRRQYEPLKVTTDLGFLSGAEWDELQAADHELISPRDHASGLPTGKRMHKPFVISSGDLDGDGSVDLAIEFEDDDAAEITSPRDHASGLPTGKRMHKPIFYGIGDVDGDGKPDFLGEPQDRQLLRDHASGLATGKRNGVFATDPAGNTGGPEGIAIDEAGTTKPHPKAGITIDEGGTPKVQHKPGLALTGDLDGDGSPDFVLSGQEAKTFTVTNGGSTNTGALRVATGDVTGDGRADITLNFSRTGDDGKLLPAVQYVLVQAGDLDGDGVPDFVFHGSQSDADIINGILIGLLVPAVRPGNGELVPAVQTGDGSVFSGRELKQYFQTGDTPTQGQFKAKPKSSAGTPDPTPATYTWTVDTTPPDVSQKMQGEEGLRIHILRTSDKRAFDVTLGGIGDVDGDGVGDFKVLSGDGGELGILIGLLKGHAAANFVPENFNELDFKTLSTNPGFLSGAEWAQLQAADHEVKSPRDAASGLATGKRMHKPFVITMSDLNGDGSVDLSVTFEDDDDSSIVSPRDSASGLPTGKRMHKPFIFYAVGDVDGDGAADFVGTPEDRAALRDHASGLPTGKRQYNPLTVKSDAGFLSGAEWAQLQTTGQAIVSPRDSASGLPTGKRMHKPFVITMNDLDGDGSVDLAVTLDTDDTGDATVVSPRDAASGLPTGKRMHKPIFYAIGDVDGDGSVDYLGTADDLQALRDAASGQASGKRERGSGIATGRRQYDPLTVKSDPGFLGGAEWDQLQAADQALASPRDAASGLPTGKRMHKPMLVTTLDVDGDGLKEQEVGFGNDLDNGIVSPRDAASGLPTGKRMHKPILYMIEDVDGDGKPDFLADPQDIADIRAYVHEVQSPRDPASGQATGKSAGGGGGTGAGDTFFGYGGKVEITNDLGTSYLTPNKTIEVGPGSAPGTAGPSGPEADAFLKDIEDPALFDQADAAAATISGNLAPIRAQLKRIDRDLKQIEAEWPKYERTQDIGKLIILWSEALKLRPELDKLDSGIWHALNNQTSPQAKYDEMVKWMQEHGVPDVDLPELLKNIRERIDELELDIAPHLKGNQQLLDQLQGLLPQGNPALGLRGDVLDTDNDGVGDATEIAIGSDPLHNDGPGGFIKLDAPDDRSSLDYPTDKTVTFEYEPLDSEVPITYDLILDAGGKESVRHNAKEAERFDLASLVGPGGLFADVIGPGGVLTISWHVEARLPRNLGGGSGKLPQIKSATRTLTINTPANQTVEVNLAAAAASTKIGTPVIVNGSITDVTALGDWEIQITYDPALLAFKQGTKRGLFSASTVFFNDARGVLTVSGSAPRGSAGITGAGDIFQLTFDALVPGRSEVAPKRVTLHDTLARTINGQPGDIAEVGVSASAAPAGPQSTPKPPAPVPGGGPLAPPVAPQAGGDSASLNLGPVQLISPKNGEQADYPGDREIAFNFTELHTKLDVSYNLVLMANGGQLTKRNYTSGDMLPLGNLMAKGGPLAGALGPNGIDIDWHIEALVDTGGNQPLKIESETRRLSVKMPSNGNVTLDIGTAHGKTHGISVNDPVFVRASLSQVNALGTWEITINYDGSVLSFISGRKMGLFSSANVRFETQGMGRLKISGQSPGAGLSGDGDCFELEFKAKGDGTCTIEADAPKLTDTLARPIQTSASGGVDVDVVQANAGGSSSPGKGQGGGAGGKP